MIDIVCTASMESCDSGSEGSGKLGFACSWDGGQRDRQRFGTALATHGD